MYGAQNQCHRIPARNACLRCPIIFYARARTRSKKTSLQILAIRLTRIFFEPLLTHEPTARCCNGERQRSFGRSPDQAATDLHSSKQWINRRATQRIDASLPDDCGPAAIRVHKHMMEIPMKTLSIILAVALLTSCSGMHSAWSGSGGGSSGGDSGYGTSSHPMMNSDDGLYSSGA